jgi:hypothetical protein
VTGAVSEGEEDCGRERGERFGTSGRHGRALTGPYYICCIYSWSIYIPLSRLHAGSPAAGKKNLPENVTGGGGQCPPPRGRSRSAYYRHSMLKLSTNAVTTPFALIVMWRFSCISRLLFGPGPMRRKLLTKVSVKGYVPFWLNSSCVTPVA